MPLYGNQTDDVSFKHPEYINSINQVNLVNNIYNGIDTAKKYLSKAPRESDTSYSERQSNSTLKNYIKRAIEAFVGMIFRRQVQAVGYSDSMLAIINKIDKKNPLSRFARDLTSELIKTGKVFLAADTPVGGGEPYAIIIPRGNVINWKKNVDGTFSMVVVYEVVEDAYGSYGFSLVEQWRVYRDDGTVELIRKNKDGDFVSLDIISTDFSYIPIVDLEIDDIPPLYDIAKMTIKHMNRTSFKDKYLDMSAVPIPLIWGANADEDTGTKPVFVIGVDEAFVFTGTKEESDFQWRELSGSSIDALQKDLAVIENDITSGVIRVAVSDSTTIKTATESYYESAESSNRVTVIASTIEIGLNKIITMLADMANEEIDSGARVIVNKDFNALVANGQDTRLLWEMYLGGALSFNTFMNSMESYELIDIGSPEEEQKRIEQDSFTPAKKIEDSSTIDNIDNRTKSML